MTEEPEKTEIRALWPYSFVPEVGMEVGSAGVVIGYITEVYEENGKYVVDMVLDGSWGIEPDNDSFSTEETND